MESSISCSSSIGQRLEGLAKRWTGWVPALSVSSHPLGDYLDGRTTTEEAPRKLGEPVVLEGSTGGITCTVTIGRQGEVEVLFEGLPECLVGTKPLMSFPVAASVGGIAWAPGPRAGIVHVVEEVSAKGHLRCLAARSRSRVAGLPSLLNSLWLLSEEGDSQPLCSIEIGLQRRDR